MVTLENDIENYGKNSTCVDSCRSVKKEWIKTTFKVHSTWYTSDNRQFYRNNGVIITQVYGAKLKNIHIRE